MFTVEVKFAYIPVPSEYVFDTQEEAASFAIEKGVFGHHIRSVKVHEGKPKYGVYVIHKEGILV